eukprot:657689-Amphidinium_carterae.1
MEYNMSDCLLLSYFPHVLMEKLLPIILKNLFGWLPQGLLQNRMVCTWLFCLVVRHTLVSQECTKLQCIGTIAWLASFIAPMGHEPCGRGGCTAIRILKSSPIEHLKTYS